GVAVTVTFGRYKRLDMINIVYIIKLTASWLFFPGVAYGSRPTQRGEAARIAPARDAQSAPRCRATRLVPWQRILRCQRSAPGQIRDVASGARREAVGDGVSQGIRLLPAFVLSSPLCLRAKRSSRSHPREAGAAGRTQTDCGGDGVLDAGTCCRAVPAPSTSGVIGEEELRCASPSTQYRAAVSAPKKTAVIPSPSRLLTSSGKESLITGYEALRQQVLGRSSAMNPGRGLALLLRSGM